MIKIAIIGYGNLGKGVEFALKQNPDMELAGVFTRRNPKDVKTLGGKVYAMGELDSFQNKIDVAVLCGGSATDLPKQGKELLSKFNTVDSFDTHANIPSYLAEMDEVGKAGGKLGAISIGWDPGLFSVMRSLFESCLPKGCTYTFWGKGVSQGHSDAIRRVEGVKAGVQYTVPVPSAIEKVRQGACPNLSTKEKHLRECFVVLKDGADAKRVEQEIKNMPNYFADYDTVVHFISEKELTEKHSKMPHGGFVLRSGASESGDNMLLELSIKLGSNPDFTSGVLVAYARAVYHMRKEGKTGAVTVYDIPLKYLSKSSYQDLVKNLL